MLSHTAMDGRTMQFGGRKRRLSIRALTPASFVFIGQSHKSATLNTIHCYCNLTLCIRETVGSISSVSFWFAHLLINTMADASNQPLDEIQWRDPEAAKFYGGINPENLHLYFMHSPFCDPQSNNKNTEVQARYNPELNAVLSDRKRFEDSLRDTMGIKYLIEEGPKQSSPDTNPVWLIRRRNKVREYGQEVSKIEGSYFAIGENIYQSPSLKDILMCRLVSKLLQTKGGC
jgi:MED6 mediator sub complex component